MRREEGSAAVIVVSVALLAMFVMTGVAGVGGIAVTRARVSAAADLAALAGAGGGGCEAVESTVRANGAQLSDCRAEHEDVVVVATDQVRFVGRTINVRAEARAGPP